MNWNDDTYHTAYFLSLLNNPSFGLKQSNPTFPEAYEKFFCQALLPCATSQHQARLNNENEPCVTITRHAHSAKQLKYSSDSNSVLQVRKPPQMI
mmetsp:Transcript_30327/g.64370  ORF Transcript_30327/g.64370 Transcript_30327/m.64370 type:complete len:95 (-) Transcript_30327:183-467(-)